MDLDLAVLVLPLVGILLGAVVFMVATLWARGVESTLAAAAAGPGRRGGADGAPDNPTVLFQPPEDSPPA